LKCIERLQESAAPVAGMPLEALLTAQGGALWWERFSLAALKKNDVWNKLVEVTQKQISFEMVYDGGTRPGQPRLVFSEGMVRSLDGDFLVAKEPHSAKTKRFLLEKIKSVVY
jgi:hypothetical protein